MLLDTYTASYGTIAEEFYQMDLPKTCEDCEYFNNAHSETTSGICTSQEMRRAVKDMMGVEFNAVVLCVKPDTDAMLCDSWTLSHDPEVLGRVEQDIEEARANERAHAEHYEYLRRPENAY